MTTYRLIKLVWEEDIDGDVICNTVFGSMRVFHVPHSGWRWSYHFEEYYDEDQSSCDSKEEGIAAAEAHYIERMEQALEKVE